MKELLETINETGKMFWLIAKPVLVVAGIVHVFMLLDSSAWGRDATPYLLIAVLIWFVSSVFAEE